MNKYVEGSPYFIDYYIWLCNYITKMYFQHPSLILNNVAANSNPSDIKLKPRQQQTQTPASARSNTVSSQFRPNQQQTQTPTAANSIPGISKLKPLQQNPIDKLHKQKLKPPTAQQTCLQRSKKIINYFCGPDLAPF